MNIKHDILKHKDKTTHNKTNKIRTLPPLGWHESYGKANGKGPSLPASEKMRD